VVRLVRRCRRRDVTSQPAQIDCKSQRHWPWARVVSRAARQRAIYQQLHATGFWTRRRDAAPQPAQPACKSQPYRPCARVVSRAALERAISTLASVRVGAFSPPSLHCLGFASLEVALGSASPCPCVAL